VIILQKYREYAAATQTVKVPEEGEIDEDLYETTDEGQLISIWVISSTTYTV